MIQIGEFKLNENAFCFLCEAMENTLPNLKSPLWRHEIIAKARGAMYQDIHRKHKVYVQPLLLKLKCLSEFEMLKLLISIDNFLGKSDKDYMKIGLQGTSSKLGEIIPIEIKNTVNMVRHY